MERLAGSKRHTPFHEELILHLCFTVLGSPGFPQRHTKSSALNQEDQEFRNSLGYIRRILSFQKETVRQDLGIYSWAVACCSSEDFCFVLFCFAFGFGFEVSEHCPLLKSDSSARLASCS